MPRIAYQPIGRLCSLTRVSVSANRVACEILRASTSAGRPPPPGPGRHPHAGIAAPDRLRRARAAGWRRNPAGSRRSRPPRGRTAIVDDEGSLTFRARCAHVRARAHVGARPASAAAPPWGSCAATAASSWRRRWPRTSSAATSSTSTRGSAAPGGRRGAGRGRRRAGLRRRAGAPLAAQATPAVAVTEAALRGGAGRGPRSTHPFPGASSWCSPPAPPARPRAPRARAPATRWTWRGVLACIPFVSGDTTVVGRAALPRPRAVRVRRSPALGSTIVLRRSSTRRSAARRSRTTAPRRSWSCR